MTTPRSSISSIVISVGRGNEASQNRTNTSSLDEHTAMPGFSSLRPPATRSREDSTSMTLESVSLSRCSTRTTPSIALTESMYSSRIIELDDTSILFQPCVHLRNTFSNRGCAVAYQGGRLSYVSYGANHNHSNFRAQRFHYWSI